MKPMTSKSWAVLMSAAALAMAVVAFFVAMRDHEELVDHPMVVPSPAPAVTRAPPPYAALVATQQQLNVYGTSAGVVKDAGSGNVFGVRCVNRGDAGVYLQLFNTTTVPGSNAVPQDQWFVAPFSMMVAGQELTVGGEAFTDAGIAYGVSTAAGSYTAATAALCDVMLTYQ